MGDSARIPSYMSMGANTEALNILTSHDNNDEDNHQGDAGNGNEDRLPGSNLELPIDASLASESAKNTIHQLLSGTRPTPFCLSATAFL